jgi:hypothetical protein
MSVLPMELQIGDRFTDQDFEWEVLTRPETLHGAKRLRARIQRLISTLRFAEVTDLQPTPCAIGGRRAAPELAPTRRDERASAYESSSSNR